MADATADSEFISQALELARQGQGLVEPNPLVGCVIARDGRVIGRGYHQRFGGPHAEIEALRDAGEAARGATAYVTLEPCCYQGKTGPCTQALIDAGIARVVVGCEDPNPKVAGQGLDQLRAAGIKVVSDVSRDKAQRLIAPFTKFVTTGRPWVIAKWAMTLDGKIATHTGSSQWISGEASRAIVHQLRGRVDAVLVGRGTVEADDPLLTARPAGPRTATRIVLDSRASLATDSKLISSIDEAPLLVAVGDAAPEGDRRRLTDLGAEVLPLDGATRSEQLSSLLDELGRREMTNVLVEGGGEVLGTLLELNADQNADQNEIDEVHAFIAPKLVGGQSAATPIGGLGIAAMGDALQLEHVDVTCSGEDVYVHGLVRKKSR